MTRFDVIELIQTSYFSSGGEYTNRRIRSEFAGSFAGAVGAEIEYGDGGLARYTGPVQPSSTYQGFYLYSTTETSYTIPANTMIVSESYLYTN